MTRLLSLKLILILIVTSLTSLSPVALSYAQTNSCENGECVKKIIDKLESLGSAYQGSCLPFNESDGLTEECWKIITEMNHYDRELQKHEQRLEERLGCQSGECNSTDAVPNLNSQLADLNKVEESLSCTEPKKKEIKNNCKQDMTCVLASTALGVGGYLAELMVPEKNKPKNCHLGNDSCVTQLATGFLKAAINFFEGAFDLLKLAGKAAGRKMNEFWDWVKGAEDHSSTSQLAMAKASADPGVFDMLVKDFPGTMKNIWGAFVSSMREWIKTDVLCQKWSGAPHFSQCLKVTETFDCIPCKTMVTGLCSITGTLVAEIVPSFLTGGLITAAKHGANGAVKIAKLYKVSGPGMKAVKKSSIVKGAVKSSTKLDDALHLSKGINAARVTINSALDAIKTYFLKPSRKILKESYETISSALKKGTPHLVISPTGKKIIFDTARLTARVIIYPIENPMTALAYRAGQRSFEKVLTLGTPKLAQKSAAASALISKESEFESLLVKISEAKAQNKNKLLTDLEEELLNKVLKRRTDYVEELLKNEKIKLNDLIEHLYPELKYGDLASRLPQKTIIEAEKELTLSLAKMPENSLKTKLQKDLNLHLVQGEARKRIIKDSSPLYDQVIHNSTLDSNERFKEAVKLLKRESYSVEETKKLSKTLEEAHLVAPDNGVFEYSWRELREKHRILVEGGFSGDEAELLIRSGLAGRPPVREILIPGKTLFNGFAQDIVENNYLEKQAELIKLLKSNSGENRNIFGTLSDFFSPSSSDVSKIQDNLDALYFIDYQHSVPELEDILLGYKKVKSADLSIRYDQKAFDNFKDARKYLRDETPSLSKRTLLEVHKKMMKGGVENVAEADLGIIRSGHYYGNVPSSKPINQKVVDEINKNPYLTWKETWNSGDGRFAGEIHYPNAVVVKPQSLDLIRKGHKDLVLEIEAFQLHYRRAIQEKITKSPLVEIHPDGPRARAYNKAIEAQRIKHDQLNKEKYILTQRLVDAMTDDLMDWFTRERMLIGDINSPEKLDQFVNIAAKFQRDLVSIHPLANGNGRSTREFALSYIFMREGLPPPRILDPNADIYQSLEDWQKIIKHGMLASDFLIDDLIERAKFGLPIENSLEIVTPYTRPPVKMKFNGKDNLLAENGVEYIDTRLYREIIKREFDANPALKFKFEKSPIDAWDKIHQKVEQTFSKNNIYYKDPRQGVQRVALTYVDDDFKHLFGKASFDNKELFDFKMKTWYSDEITWRGLASKHSEKTEAEIIEMFTNLTPHNASNAVLKKVGGASGPEAIKKAVFEDFERYNNDVFGDGLVAMVKDHSEVGPMYGMSYGFSTSKIREVGKEFAMGAMMLAENGDHMLPELQALLKSRVLVGARRANKDVDLTRLYQLREDFSYKHWNEAEVMGVGASDPDAITIIQTLDNKGEVTLSYLRNKNNPKEVFVIKGEVEPDEIPSPEKIFKIINLK